MRVLVVAPHPDDEVLGVGGTIARLSDEGADVHVLTLTKGCPPEFDGDQVEQLRGEVLVAHEILGVAGASFLEFPAACLDTVPHRDINAAVLDAVSTLRPRMIFLPFPGDIHADHRAAFSSTLVAARPNREDAPSSLYAYETLSETNWNAPYLTPDFAPNAFFDISGYLDTKLQALRAFRSQVRAFPNERSIESVKNLATFRGSTICRHAAEAFVVVRQIH